MTTRFRNVLPSSEAFSRSPYLYGNKSQCCSSPKNDADLCFADGLMAFYLFIIISICRSVYVYVYMYMDLYVYVYQYLYVIKAQTA